MDNNGNLPEVVKLCDGCGLPMSYCVCDEEEDEEFDLIGD